MRIHTVRFSEYSGGIRVIIVYDITVQNYGKVDVFAVKTKGFVVDQTALFDFLLNDKMIVGYEVVEINAFAVLVIPV